ncbi:Transcription initiation factor, partial [Globisporangium splendens]
MSKPDAPNVGEKAAPSTSTSASAASAGASVTSTPAAASAGDGAAAPAKKKNMPKSRKRKASDAGVSSKTGASPATKKSATGDSSASAIGAGGTGAGASGAGAGTSGGAAGAGGAGSADGLVKPFVKGELVESIKHMMFGFGDESEPLSETAEVMEDMVVEYVNAMTKKAMDMAVVKGKLDTECFIFLIRKDPERYERIAELLRANDELRAVLNSGFDPSDEKMY